MADYLHPDEWLADAKRLPVGRSERVYHGAEKRKNLVVYNNVDSWSCYCHSCHKGGSVKKENVKFVITPPPEPQSSPVGVLYPLDISQPNPNIPYKEIVGFLHSKSMTLDYLARVQAKYSPAHKRIVIAHPDQTLGRDITGQSKVKWFRYSGSEMYCRAAMMNCDGKSVVLTEDYFSAIKGQAFAPDGFLCIALLGTVLHDNLLRQLIKAKSVHIFLDADAAGRKAAPDMYRILKLLGVPVFVSYPPTEGDDPKNLTPSQWEDYFNSQVRLVPCHST